MNKWRTRIKRFVPLIILSVCLIAALIYYFPVRVAPKSSANRIEIQISSEAGSFYLTELQTAQFLDTLEATDFRRLIFSNRGIHSRTIISHVTVFADGRAIMTLDFFPEGFAQITGRPTLRAIDPQPLTTCMTQFMQCGVAPDGTAS